MEISTTTLEEPTPRRAAVNALAVVGFVTLLCVGVTLAVYGARYVPAFVSRIGSAAVSLSQTLTSGAHTPASLEVITASSSLPISVPGLVTATSTATSTIDTITAGLPTATTHTPTTSTAPHGKADLSVVTLGTGYLSNNASDSFVASGTVPSGKHGAIKFVVTNVGTNYSGTWQFTANIPSAPTFTSPMQQSLGPNDRIEYVLGFDQVQGTSDRIITISVDDTNSVSESNESNNAVSTVVAKSE